MLEGLKRLRRRWFPCPSRAYIQFSSGFLEGHWVDTPTSLSKYVRYRVDDEPWVVHPISREDQAPDETEWCEPVQMVGYKVDQ